MKVLGVHRSRGSRRGERALTSPSTALVHDWLTGMRGGEKVLLSLARLFPDAPIFTLLHVRGCVGPGDRGARHPHDASSSACPAWRRTTASYLPLFPAAAESFDLSGFDLVVSSSHCVAKGVRAAPGALHLCYCHTPMRYVWDRYDDYFGPGRVSAPDRALACPRSAAPCAPGTWPPRTRVHHYAANSALRRPAASGATTAGRRR